jgi:hypothetical protein
LHTEGGANGGHQPIPVIGFFAQALATGSSEFVKLGAAIVLRGTPTGFEQTLPNQAKQAGIERALFDQQRVAGDLSDAQEDAVAVQRAERDGAQDKKIESAGKELGLIGQWAS